MRVVNLGAFSATATSYPILKRGTKGDSVVNLQLALNASGATVTVDGVFGQQTYDAVLAFQRTRGLAADGIVGSNTWSALLAGAPATQLVASPTLPIAAGIVPSATNYMPDATRITGAQPALTIPSTAPTKLPKWALPIAAGAALLAVAVLM